MRLADNCRKTRMESILFGSILAFLLLPMHGRGQEADSTLEMRGVEVTTRRFSSPLHETPDGIRHWSLQSMHHLPKIMGNADPIHFAEFLPGVQTTSEYDAGLHVWGCDNAHNDLSVDGIPLYGVQHLLGFFSVFNASHFQSMTFAPTASLMSSSNRLGALLQMNSAGSIPDSLTGELSVGPLSSQGTLRLPLGRKTALIVSGREAYLNLLYGRWLRIDNEQLHYSFGDYNLTLKHQAAPRHYLQLNFYAGHDRALYDSDIYQGDVGLRWGNQMIGMEHRYELPSQGVFSQTAYFTRYASNMEMRQQELNFKLFSSIADVGYRAKLDWRQWHVSLDASALRVQPQTPDLTGRLHTTYANEPVQHTQHLGLKGEYRLTLPHGWLLRPTLKMICLFNDQHSVSLLPAPALTAEWQTASAGTFVLHAALQQQPLFQTGMTNMGLPLEFWLSSGRYGRPQRAWHVSLSHEIIFGHGAWSFSTSLYYKKLQNQIEYQGSLFDFMNTNYNLQHSLLHGKGWNYGGSVMLSRRTGPVTGWISYTYTRSRRQFDDGNYPGTYPSNHERPHELNILATWNINQHWNVGGTFTFCSGTPFTAVSHISLINYSLLVQYGEYNACRLKPYGRLDLSVNYNLKNTAHRECGFNFSLYNASAFNNELFYRVRIYDNGFAYRARRFLLPVLPSISFFIKWK